jgi:hypothetical protein
LFCNGCCKFVLAMCSGNFILWLVTAPLFLFLPLPMTALTLVPEFSC